MDDGISTRKRDMYSTLVINGRGEKREWSSWFVQGLTDLLALAYIPQGRDYLFHLYYILRDS
jgi:hypothetical protein